MLSGHPPARGIADIPFVTGSLGHGVGLAAGLALGQPQNETAGRVICLTSDGEWNEGSTWESLIFAKQQHLANLVVLVDQNGLQGFGTTSEVDDLSPLADKFRAFGLTTWEIDGHDQAALTGVLNSTAIPGPCMIVAIPIMYRRLKDTFQKLNVDHEIIFVNDCSPDDSEEIIRLLSQDDPRVLGISHSRNFGSQAAFMSGLRIANKNSCVLLDGDLQDPPELIEQFVTKWREGFDVVYGRRVKRDATLFMQFAYKAFYRVFDFFSYVTVPHDAGDFSLLDRKVVQALTQFPERDLFLRGLRAFAGFKQVGVDNHRPERMFGRSTNSLLGNLGWAKKGILSFSNTPLNMLSVMGVGLLLITFTLAILQVVLRLWHPEWVPQGLTTVLLAIMFFGSLSIFAIAVVGEYIAKIFEEVKRRPLYIRHSLVRHGEIRNARGDVPSARGVACRLPTIPMTSCICEGSCTTWRIPCWRLLKRCGSRHAYSS